MYPQNETSVGELVGFLVYASVSTGIRSPRRGRIVQASGSSSLIAGIICNSRGREEKEGNDGGQEGTCADVESVVWADGRRERRR